MRPAGVREEDVQTLRRAGLDDRAIVDANQVVAYFNYVNRIADGLGVELERDWPEHLRDERSYALGSTGRLPVVAADALPWLTVEQMREVDRIAGEEIGLDLVLMMENAGRNLAVVARLLLGGDATGRRVLVLAGPGGNGGGGLVAARHLAAAGASVSVSLATARDALAPRTRDQLAILSALDISADEPATDADLVLDALLGYGQSGAPRGRFASLLEWTRGRRTVSLDVPTGVELETDTVNEPHVQADATMTIAAPKLGLRSPEISRLGGQLFLGDISIPAGVYQRLGVRYEMPFGAGPLVRIDRDESKPEWRA